MVRVILFCFLILISSTQLFGQQYLGDKNRDVYDIAVQGNVMGAITENSVELWSLTNRTLIKSIRYNDKNKPTVISFGLDSLTLIVGSRSGEVTVWKMGSGENSVLLAAVNTGAVTSMDVNRERKLLAVGFSERRMALYSLPDMREEVTYVSYNRDVTAVKFSKDNDWLITADGSGQIVRMSMDTRTSETIGNDNGWITSLGMSSDSTQMAIATSSGKLRVMKELTTREFFSIDGGQYKRFITSIDFHMNEPNCFCLSSLSGLIEIVLGRNSLSYTYKSSAIVNQVRFLPTKDKLLSIAIATTGKGLQIIDGKEMKSK